MWPAGPSLTPRRHGSGRAAKRNLMERNAKDWPDCIARNTSEGPTACRIGALHASLPARLRRVDAHNVIAYGSDGKLFSPAAAIESCEGGVEYIRVRDRVRIRCVDCRRHRLRGDAHGRRHAAQSLLRFTQVAERIADDTRRISRIDRRVAR